MMSGEMMRVPYRELDVFTESVLTKLGIPPGDARIVVDKIVDLFKNIDGNIDDRKRKDAVEKNAQK